ncbi:carbohydrate-binding protein [Algibacter pectinivorans]|uniref:Por secretion system C-terminal sorting domain-containing protein n=1 Tax=Algibacter pectinivorans TaxID=870482 RepID=A0A1I1QYT6_9FLAO|nr:carbohydrate-binding protein [Algibacter pectinivorans]SFD27276.1 Por secretion system C-terminal sorting domain-containing protein [Algibacter pectinivorans]
MNKNTSLKKIYYKYVVLAVYVLLFNFKVKAQEYPFSLPNNITASLNVETANTEVFNNKLIGYNIQGFDTQTQKDFVNLVDPVTIRFPHGVWANFYEWETDGYQQDSYDNRDHQDALDIFVSSITGDIDGIAALNTEKKNRIGGKGYDMMWTYSINFDDGASSVARAQKDIGLGLEVKAIELGNEHFWRGQRALRTETPEMYLLAATEVSSALKAEFPDIKLSLPLSWRRSHASYNNTVKGDGSFFDAVTIHKYLGADPDVPGESNSAYSALLTAKLELAEDVNWVRDNYAQGKPVWLTEWGVSAGSEVHAGACLGMADVFMYMSKNQDVYERANWFIFNRVLNAMVVVGDNREPVYPLQKRGYLSTYEIIQDVFRDATMLNGNLTSSAQLVVSRGSVNAVNARATINEFGETKVVAVNLTDKPVTFELRFNNVAYSNNFKHEALVFDNLGVVAPIDYFSDALQLIKEGKGTITLPPLSVSRISGIYYDETIALIPGTIEAEDYKEGGQGVGYFDTTPDNTLSTGIDTDGVDVGTENNIVYVGDTQNGEWLKYDLNVLETGNYDFEFIYAAQNTGALVSLEIDDVVLFDNFLLAKTGSSSNFQSVTKLSSRLTKGLHELKIHIQNEGFNLDKIHVLEVMPIEAPIFVTPNHGYNIMPGGNIEVEASTTFAPENIASMDLFVNDVLVRSVNKAPFTWGYSGQNDALLENISSGSYTLKLVLTDKRNRTKETAITVSSNNYPTQPYLGAPHVVPGTIQLEDFDRGGEGFAFSDTDIGNSGGVYRTEEGENVDVSVGGTNFILNSLRPNEYTRYTIDVKEAGKYEMIINYRTFSTTSKSISAYVLPRDLSSSTELFFDRGGSMSSGIIRSENETGSVVFLDYQSLEFELLKGQFVLEFRIPQSGNGPSYDYITLNKVGSLSVNEENASALILKVYPIPSKNGVFNLSKPKKWKVYTLLGAKITEGNSNFVDISKNSKGIYLLKTEDGIIKRLLFI